MSNNIITRKDGEWLVISLVPDVCKTPIGSSIIPIPYPTVAKLGDAVKEIPHIKANGAPLVTIAGHIPTTQGAEVGVKKGIKSGTVGGAASYKKNSHSSNVRAGKQPILRHGDMFWMNGEAPDSPLKQSTKKMAPTPREVELAKVDGSSPEQITAREKVSRYYLENNGFSELQVTEVLGSKDGSRVGGIDLKKPVAVISFPPPEHMTQYVKSHGFPGNWFDPKGMQSPDALGISGEGRTLSTFLMPRASGLQSHAKPIVDNWTNPTNPTTTSGGGVQLFVNETIKKQVIAMNKIGNPL